MTVETPVRAQVATPEFQDYAKEVVANARALAEELRRLGRAGWRAATNRGGKTGRSSIPSLLATRQALLRSEANTNCIAKKETDEEARNGLSRRARKCEG